MKYTSAQKIVYSTCSVHPEEDELVVLAALDSSECKSGGWTLAERKDVLPSWERRGRKEVMGQRAHLADSLICCEPGTDKTNVSVPPLSSRFDQFAHSPGLYRAFSSHAS